MYLTDYNGTSHRSKSDVVTVANLFERLIEKIGISQSIVDIDAAVNMLLEITLQRMEPSGFIMPFGRHKGKELQEIAKYFPDYLEWVLDNFEDEGGEKGSSIKGMIQNLKDRKTHWLLEGR